MSEKYPLHYGYNNQSDLLTNPVKTGAIDDRSCASTSCYLITIETGHGSFKEADGLLLKVFHDIISVGWNSKENSKSKVSCKLTGDCLKYHYVIIILN